MDNFEQQNLCDKESEAMPDKGRVRFIFRVIALAAAFSVGYLSATVSFNQKYGIVPLDVLGHFAVIENLLDEYYYKDYDKGMLYEYAKTGMIYGLEDPYSYYLSEEGNEEFTESITGNYVGVGLTLSPSEEGGIMVVAPFDGSPAHKAGILPGDILFKVNDTPYMYEDIDEAVSIMKGKEGESVTLELIREGSENIVVELNKAKIDIDSVVGKKLEDDINYIRISRFDLTTYDDFMDVVLGMGLTADSKLILDLRDNPGGIVSTCTSIADEFLEEGVIITEKYRNRKDETINAKTGALVIAYPIVVLVNGNTASASEILTGALKDYEKATVIGTKTFGKGVMNQRFAVDGKNSVVITIAQYLTPNGSNIHDVGIEPDIEVQIDENIRKSVVNLTEEEDTQLKRAIEYIKTGE